MIFRKRSKAVNEYRAFLVYQISKHQKCWNELMQLSFQDNDTEREAMYHCNMLNMWEAALIQFKLTFKIKE